MEALLIRYETVMCLHDITLPAARAYTIHQQQ
jgi:hypothetical protein